jgi:alkanesulfonate monooxygenase SsuD/methylene tetrahydromethanopterin reductase-like flavin-dependent oxidoreductase (luciferase family)
MLTAAGEPFSFEGKHYRVHEAPARPPAVQRPRPPLWVGGFGDRLLGVVARAADGWNTSWSVEPEWYDQRLEVLRGACARVGRPFDSVRRTLGLATLIGRDPDDLAERWRRLQAWAPGGALDGADLREWAGSRLVGTPEEILAQLRAWRRRGVEQVVCSFSNAPFGIFEDEQLDLIATHVIPHLT